MGNIMISMPMAGLTEEQIQSKFKKKKIFLESLGFTVVNTVFISAWYSNTDIRERGIINKPLCFIAKSLEAMSTCGTVYFCKGWSDARGCRIEHEAAKAYGLEIIYE